MRKYKCEVALSAEDDIAGYVYLTKEQYEAVNCDEIQEGNDGSVTA